MRRPTNGEELRDIQHSMSMVLRHEVSFLIHFDTLLQIATDIIANCDSYFIKNATEICYKMRPFYSKMRQLLQIATILLQIARTLFSG